MKRTKTEKILAAHYEALMPDEITRLITLASYDLYFGPLVGCNVCGVDSTHDCTCAVRWQGFSDAIGKLRAWAEEHLPSEVWVDMDCGSVSESEPQGEEIDGEWQEPFTENTVYFDCKGIKQAVFGKLAEYF